MTAADWGVDQIYIISLPERSDRRMQASDQMRRYYIPASFWPARKYINGAEGLYRTMMDIFEISVRNNWYRIMILEDDFYFLCDPLPVITQAMRELPHDWQMLYLGCNIPRPSDAEACSANLIRLKRALALHAVIYSRTAMEAILRLEERPPLDVMIASSIHPQGKSYCTYPILCVQTPGYSNIENRHTDYKPFIQERYDAAIEKLFLKQ